MDLQHERAMRQVQTLAPPLAFRSAVAPDHLFDAGDGHEVQGEVFEFGGRAPTAESGGHVQNCANQLSMTLMDAQFAQLRP